MRKYICGVFLLLAVASAMAMGAVPERGRVLDDSVIYQNLSEIKAAKEKDLNFDRDVAHLDSIEQKYKEKLPRLNNGKRTAHR